MIMQFQPDIALIKISSPSPLKAFISISFIGRLLLIINFIFASFATAAGGRVEALQMPAWLDRGGVLSALKPGINLQPGDKLITGANARLLLKMDEGSLVKLGENAELYFDKLIPAEEEQGFFEATMRLIKGAFRFTTTTLGKTRRRQVSVSIGSITAGIRGTDIWGSSTIDKDILCLIEGKITAKRTGEPEFKMQDSLSSYIVPKNKPALPVAPVPEAKLAKWANETELQTASGILSIDGKWAVNLMSVTNNASIRPVMASLTAAGYAAQIERAEIKGKNWYRLRVSSFKTPEDARAFAKTIEGTHGIASPWIIKF